MDYISVPEARQESGLRLVLCAGTPGVWGEAIKAILAHKNIRYTAVAQRPGGENPELEAWTGQSSAPVLMDDDPRVRASWESQLYHAEVLAPNPALIPEDFQQRALMMGLIREIAGENGFGWNRRLHSILVSGGPSVAEPLQRLADKYGWSDDNAAQSIALCEKILDGLDSQLRASGGPYYLGETLSAVDFYSAVFLGVMLEPLAADTIPMPDGMRWCFEQTVGNLSAHFSARLKANRELMFAKHIATPLDF